VIPQHISLSGFLSYREPVDLDLTGVSLAAISGPNGAGKSSLLDAITWVLFGQARKRDDSVINLYSSAAEVMLIFSYEGNTYRVQRTKVRDKAAMLEFYIWQGDRAVEGSSKPVNSLPDGGSWKNLTERSLRETEACIESTLRLDYETFVNASFFLQGKADQFTQQRPGDRKRILGSILGLEVWEEYRQRSSDRRKGLESEIAAVDGRLAEINLELAEEDARKQKMQDTQAELTRLSQARAAQEKALEGLRKVKTTLDEQRKMVQALGRQLEAASRRSAEGETRLAERMQERDRFANLLERSAAVEKAYADWQQARLDLERWEEVASQFREHEKRRQGPLDEINRVGAGLEEQLKNLAEVQIGVEKMKLELPDLERQAESVRAALKLSEDELSQKEAFEKDLDEARQRQAEARAENPRLKHEMDELKERIERLEGAEGADCPLCGQALSPSEREILVISLKSQGKEMGDRYRKNQALLREADSVVIEFENKIKVLSRAEAVLRDQLRLADQLADRILAYQKAIQNWDQNEAPRMAEITRSLQEGSFAPEARRTLEEIDAELKAIGYDAAAHDNVRKTEAAGRSSEAELRELEKARAALEPLEREIADLKTQMVAHNDEAARLVEDYRQASEALEAAEAQAPDLWAAERDLLHLQEQENRLHMEFGAARQKVLILDDLKDRSKSLQGKREVLARKVGQYKQLERAFGKDGVPALLIEQALPQIEARTNELLDRLSDGNMNVRFITQAAYKDKRRDDLRETLTIQISDGVGTRDYEMFSGGEAFRVNFAIRLALSKVLAQRAGARLQTLIIDEGFGSQDAQGRHRLIEAINLVRGDFAKIFVITHIDELKEVFPTRIEVEKTTRGSMITVF
jgi:DNA repair protein SbcC/Rad50